jgi:hypothetical protein
MEEDTRKRGMLIMPAHPGLRFSGSGCLPQLQSYRELRVLKEAMLLAEWHIGTR